MFNFKETTIFSILIILISLTIITAFIIGLNREIATDNWDNAAHSYKCTVEQFKKVNNQAGWCTKNTDYFSTYCYDTAITNFCTKRTSNVSHN